jgi:phosphomevalonate kinase
MKEFSAIKKELIRKLEESSDYKNRFVAEYILLKNKYDKLHNMIVKYEAGTLNFTPSCSLELLKKQASIMGQYLYVLEMRAEIEIVDIDDVIDKLITHVKDIIDDTNNDKT